MQLFDLNWTTFPTILNVILIFLVLASIVSDAKKQMQFQ
jgi:hypothetical protein